MNDNLINCASFQFHNELDIFRSTQSDPLSVYHFNGHPSVKDAIEAQGVPHPEVELIVVNGQSVNFSYLLQDRDLVYVYPPPANIEILPRIPLREPLSGVRRFVVDVNLGKLARLLRMLGFDTLYDNCFSDETVAGLAFRETRIALSRDRLLLHRNAIIYGYWVRSQQPNEQIQEVIQRYDLREQFKPLCRCLNCNGLIQPVSKQEILERLKPKTRRYYDEFFICPDCAQIYWKGSHFDQLRPKLARISHQAGPLTDLKG